MIAIVAFLAVAFAHEGHTHDHSAESDGHQHVLDLDQSSFQSAIEANELTLVEFYAPWCGHCQRLAPEYEKAATELYGSSSVLAKVDCTVDKDLCSQYGVEGFPTLKLFRKDGGVSDYTSGRTAPDIVKFMKRQSEPAVHSIETVDALSALKAGSEVAIVGFFDSLDHSGAHVLRAVANELRNEFSFGLTKESSIFSSAGASANSIVVYRQDDGASAVLTGEISEKSLSDFIKAESFPLVGEIGPENYSKYVDRGLPFLWAFINYDSHQTLLADLKIIAEAYKGALSVVKLDGTRWASHARTLGLSGEVPGLVIEDRNAHKKWVFPETETANLENIRTFVAGWKDKSLAPTLKSQEPPADNNGPVKVLTGKTFDAIVNDPTKDVLVEFYAPWCGHCKTLAPKYEALGEEFASHPSIVIAKVDATENDTPANVQGFPTLIYYPANNKEGLTYRGERSKEALAAYVREHSHTLKAEKDDL